MKLEKDSKEVLGIPDIGHLHFKLATKKLQTIGVYKGQPKILFYLYNNDGINNCEIARKLDLEPPTVSVVINRMCAKDLIEKDEENRLHLTNKGKDIAKKCNKILNDLDEVVYKDFTDKEKEQLEKLFKKIEKNLKEELRSDN